jgi:hypothetical protein
MVLHAGRATLVGHEDELEDWRQKVATGRFLLALWDPYMNGGRFDVMEALKRWDTTHRELFLNWAKSPWWP